MSGLLNHSKFRMEMISFQMNDDFGPQLEEIISAIYSKIEKNISTATDLNRKQCFFHLILLFFSIRRTIRLSAVSFAFVIC